VSPGIRGKKVSGVSVGVSWGNGASIKVCRSRCTFASTCSSYCGVFSRVIWEQLIRFILEKIFAHAG
jgi:hypothetical protein